MVDEKLVEFLYFASYQSEEVNEGEDVIRSRTKTIEFRPRESTRMMCDRYGRNIRRTVISSALYHRNDRWNFLMAHPM